jgi:hypothetical protein
MSRHEAETRNANADSTSRCETFLIRPIDSHAGHGLKKIDNCNQLAEYLALQDADEFFIAPFIDYRSDDGLYRKYRIAMIDGEPFAAHMATSPNWMVHYLNADMLNNPVNRRSEAEFMGDFDLNFAVKHHSALDEINRRIGLDYYSLDCAETRNGDLLVFEVDSGAVVHSMDSKDLFPYKAPQMTRVFEAFQRMLWDRLPACRRMTFPGQAA